MTCSSLKVTLWCICLGMIVACKSAYVKNSSASSAEQNDLTTYVDPYIGTGFHGHVFLGANVPFGAVQLGPTQISEGWDWCSGYHYSDSVIIGFAHTHLSGTGIGDLGDVLIMPTTGNVKVTKGTPKDLNSGYSSLFSHSDEIAKPGYYSVLLKRYGIKAELTATERVGFHQYTFPKSSDAHLVIDLKEGIGWDLATVTRLEKLNDSTLIGFRNSKGWAPDQRLFFTIIFSKPIKQFDLYNDQTPVKGTMADGNRIKGVVSFATTENEIVHVKVGISPVSADNALANIQTELPHWNFTKVVNNAKAAWNKELNKVAVQSNDTKRLKIFYTALYHTMIAPSTFNDHNGDYRGTDKQIYRSAPFTNLTTFSLWDTYRGANPLFTLVQPQRVNDMVNSMLAIYQQQGKLPVWHLMGNETNTMPGNSAIPVIADACLKGFNGFDVNLAFEAMKASAMLDERGLNYVKKQGYIPANAELESVSKGMEYSIDDWSIAQVAKMLGKEEDYQYFSKRGANYKNYFDPAIRFVRGRISDTEWRTPFSPFITRHMKDDFAEGNSWQYTWLVPHDVEGLVQLMGGEKKFTDKLDSLFVIKGDMGNEASNDITGLIGLYAHGNEPSHHITYMYAYVGQPWKTAEKVRYILDNLYTEKPDGLSGNEDVGQMSAWYVLSSLGFYSANPANGAYVMGSPVFDDIRLTVGENKTFHIQIKNNGPQNLYIQRMTLNGTSYPQSYLLHKDIIKGGELVIEMGSKPSKTWGVAKENWARSLPE
ncbi:GH92 family glycosyl hydrolase [Cytophagaceae bacterium DM2B3-1]|uniref:GH92 family glycosyl hydrolase n=1 Tax=Xanthocytophaga flava TaxID=3048013 RepID=A0ABT7CNT8_9BACT|nr:GH92 family glycosyl hydrolase [Xanthocytophaga flavus]MDJ1495355.1 GH92 family glycosyl hydrolase [Xanthocytophaga flavus]